jgi:hypothetical protein
MWRTVYLKCIVSVACLRFFGACSVADAQILTYKIVAGSIYNNIIVGHGIVPYALTGTFEWAFVKSDSNLNQFAIENLSLTSALIDIQMNNQISNSAEVDFTPQNFDMAASVIVNNNLNDIETLQIDGTYNGQSSAPAVLNVINGTITDSSGITKDIISFQAQLVPEPSTLALLALGSLGLLVRRKFA